MKDLGDKVTIMAHGIIEAKELTYDGVKYRIVTDEGHLCYVLDKNIIKEEVVARVFN